MSNCCDRMRVWKIDFVFYFKVLVYGKTNWFHFPVLASSAACTGKSKAVSADRAWGFLWSSAPGSVIGLQHMAQMPSGIGTNCF